MRIDEYAKLDAVEIAALVRRGEVSASAVTEAALGAIAALNPRLNAVVLQDPERAADAARSVGRTGPLAGVPFLIKDVDIHVREWPTTYSSRFFVDAAPRGDSEIARRWRDGGAVFLGKTNTPEFADDFVTEPVLRGPTLNPWNPAVTVGGSSGGAAAAVASGMVPAAHGSDVGGSIRVPAACCGLFGFKPSRGLNPVGPFDDETGGGLNTEHVLTRTVRDSAAFLDVTAGPEPGAAHRIARAVPSYLAALREPTGRLRIASIALRADGSPVDPAISDRLVDAERLLRDLGHDVVPARLPDGLEALTAGDGWMPLWMADIAVAIREHAATKGRRPRADDLEALPRHVVERFESMSAFDYLAARRVAHRVRLLMQEAFGGFDMLLTPTTGTLPPPVGQIDSHSAGFSWERWTAAAYGFAPFTELFNVTGQPAASLPLFESAGGLPIGIQIVGRQDEDHRVLQVAARLEAATGWARRHPPVWAGALAAG